MNIALIIAGGTGSRLNPNIPKQFLTVNNKPIIIYTLEKFENHPNVDEIYIVCLDGWQQILKAYINQYKITKVVNIVTGGNTGFESIRNGIKVINELRGNNTDVKVLIHDGNRPNVTNDIISDSIVKCSLYGSGVPVTKINEVVLELDDKNINQSKSFIDRDKIVRTQTPQTYPLKTILELHEKAILHNWKGFVATCDLMIMDKQSVTFSIGNDENFKITTEDDLNLFKAIIERDGK